MLDLDLSGGCGVGYLAESFWHSRWSDQREFFLLTFLMLFRRHGLFGLHANGVVKEETGALIVGNSGRGKTTLMLALIADGWHYLSDDAIMLQHAGHGIEALAFRRGLSYTRQTVRHFPKLNAVAEIALPIENGKRVVDVESLYPGRFADHCRPGLLIFPKISGEKQSRLVSLDVTGAMTFLIEQSPGIMVDRPVVSQQLDVLKRLAQQATSYQLHLGTDVYETPAKVSALLWSAQRGN